MAKRILLDALVKLLGEYIELNEDSLDLNLAVWSGKIILHNLKLKALKILRSYNISILHGVIKTLEITIPWTALLNTPVRVVIDGVFLQIGPLDIAALDKAETKKRVHNLKMQKLKLADKYLNNRGHLNSKENKSSSSEDSAGHISYLQQWTARIVDNIEISLRNVHIRYEDSSTIPGTLFSAGITLDSFDIMTCDENWREVFVARDLSLSKWSIRKISRLVRLSMYWCTQSKSFADASFEEWIKLMERRDASTAANTLTPSSESYLLNPDNNLTIKLTHNEGPQDHAPKYDISIDCSTLHFRADKSQFLQILKTVDMLNAVERQRQPFSYRPIQRPCNSDSARAWWRYACKLAIKKPVYIQLFKRSKALDLDTGWEIDKRTPAEKILMNDIEEKMPVTNLIIFRDVAMRELARERNVDAEQRRRRANEQQQNQQSGRSWWNWFQNSDENTKSRSESLSSIVQHGEDVSVSSIVALLDNSCSDNVQVQSDALLYRIRFEASASLELCYFGKSISRAAMSLAAECSISLISMSASCSMFNAFLTDCCTPSPLFRHIVAVHQPPGSLDFQSSTEIPTISISYICCNKKTTVRVSALPVEIVLNKDCIQNLIAMFAVPAATSPATTSSQLPADPSTRSQARMNTSNHRKVKKSIQKPDIGQIAAVAVEAATSTNDSTFELHFEANCPMIIIPEDTSTDNGFFVLDAGYLAIKGSNDVSGMKWNCKLSNIHAGMPERSEDICTLREQASLHLIKPFDVALQVQTVDKSSADMTVDVTVLPEIRGVLDDYSLTRLLKVANVVRSFSAPKVPTSSSSQSVHGAHSSVELHVAIENNQRNHPMQFDSEDYCMKYDGDHEETGFDAMLTTLSHSKKKEDWIVEDFVDPEKVMLKIQINIPAIALDLVYDRVQKDRMVFSTNALFIDLTSRKYDSRMLLELGSLSIQDFKRAEEQRDVVSTDPDSGKLVTIIHTSIFDKRSPMYSDHAMSLEVSFAALVFNSDVVTISHLKPFFIVLSSDTLSQQDLPNEAVADSELEGTSDELELDDEFIPIGMELKFYLENFTVAVFKASPVNFGSSTVLDSAYMLQISGLFGHIKVAELTSADIRVSSIDIADVREVSKFYAFRKIFCPVSEFEQLPDVASPGNSQCDIELYRTGCSTPAMKAIKTAISTSIGDGEYEAYSHSSRSGFPVPVPAERKSTRDILAISYTQETKEIAFVDITAKNLTVFVAVDTILDMINVVVDNLMAIIGLTASSPQNKSTKELTQRAPSSSLPSSSPKKTGSYKAVSTLTLNVKIVNPRLILLDDPSIDDSRAMVSRGTIDVIYTVDNRLHSDGKPETQESIHVTVTDFEMLVLLDMRRWHPRPLLEPFGLDVHVRRRLIDSILVSTNISTDVDAVKARVSMHDILLAQSIVSRRAIMVDDIDSPADLQKASVTPVLEDTSDVNFPDISPSLTVSICVDTISLVAVNDFRGRNIPVCRIIIADTTYFLESVGDNNNGSKGEGSLQLSADYFNPHFSVWEPIVERWQPKLVVMSAGRGVHYEICATDTLQFTISSSFLGTFIDTYSELLRTDSINEREKVPEITINNFLGEEISLLDSTSGEHVVSLAAFHTVILNDKPNLTRAISLTGGSTLGTVDLIVQSRIGSERQPVRRLPLDIHKSKVCNLFPKHNDVAQNMFAGNSVGIASGQISRDIMAAGERPAESKPSTAIRTGKSNKLFPGDVSNESKEAHDVADDQEVLSPLKRYMLSEPVIEDVYEYSRYDPISRQWRAPYVINDPFEWSDETGVVLKAIQNVQIDLERWEWQDSWSVDMCGQELDADGWSYAASFNSFSLVTNGHSVGPMDTCRRRRWVRPKVAKLSAITERIRPLILVWDVQALENGATKIDIHSGFQILNSLPYPISVSLSCTTWVIEEELRPILPGELFSVPLAFSTATAFSVRPFMSPQHPLSDASSRTPSGWTALPETSEGCEVHVSQYLWSPSIACKRQTQNFERFKNVSSECTGQPVRCIRVGVMQKNKQLLISLESYVEIANVLPCALGFRCISSSKREEGFLKSGETWTLRSINCNSDLELSLRVGRLNWTKFRSIDIENCQESMAIDVLNSREQVVLVLKLAVTKIRNIYRIEIFTPVAVVDRSGQQVCVLSLRNGKSILRRTSQKEKAIQPLRREAATGPRSTGKGLHARSLAAKLATLDDEMAAEHQHPEEIILPSGQESAIVDIEDLVINSSNTYEVGIADVGELVYVDSSWRWSYIPTTLRSCRCIRTNLRDRNKMDRSLISFAVKSAAIVLILTDIVNQPLWIQSQGFVRLAQQALAKNLSNYPSSVKETAFAIFGKLLQPDELISLPGNWSKSSCKMYSVFLKSVNISPSVFNVLNSDIFRTDEFKTTTNESKHANFLSAHVQNDGTDRLVDQILYEKIYNEDYCDYCWTEGDCGISMMFAENETIALGLDNGTVWSDDLTINSSTNNSSASVEVINWENMRSYQLSYSLSTMPGMYQATQQLTFFPTYVIVNCLSIPLFVRQVNTEEEFLIHQFQSESWHKTSALHGSKVHLRCEGSMWSLGAVAVNEIGTNMIILPLKPSESNGQSKNIVLNVEVKLAEPGENASIVIVIWEAKVEGSMNLSIRNESDVPVSVRQNLGDPSHYFNTSFSSTGIEQQLNYFDVSIPPGACVPYGWTDPEAPAEVFLTVGAEFRVNDKRKAKINMLRAGESLRLPDGSGKSGPSGELILMVKAELGGRVLVISRVAFFDSKIGMTEEGQEIEGTNDGIVLGLGLTLDSVAVSLVLDKPKRREFLSMYIYGVEAQCKFKNDSKSFEFVVTDLQIDNYSETQIYPVLLHSTKKEFHKSSAPAGGSSISQTSSSTEEINDSSFISEKPLIQLTLFQSISPSDSTTIYKYCALRVLELVLRIDSATIQLLLHDCLNDLKFISCDQAEAIQEPVQWVRHLNRKLLCPKEELQLVDVFEAKKFSQTNKMYFESLIIHPVKISLSFVQTTFPRSVGRTTLKSAFVNFLSAFAGVENMTMKLKSFCVEDALETTKSLSTHILNSAVDDLISQYGQIAGSLTMLGSPATFARKVGSGVKAFFYEPYQGAVESPQHFIAGFSKGVSKGTSRLFANVVSGAMNSTVAFVGTASKSISYLSGDPEFVRKREAKKMSRRQDNILASISHGGESVASGFVSGVSGLVHRPMEGAMKSGFTGFLQGIGVGLVGAAVKPLLGFAEGVTSVASGIHNEVADKSKTLPVRPARALERSAADAADLIITPLNLDAAVAQEFVFDRARLKGYSDSYLGYVPIDGLAEAIILSETYLFWRSSRKLWGRTWTSISHCVLLVDHCLGICLYSSGDKLFEIVAIPFKSFAIAAQAYSVLDANRHRMGNPAAVIPTDYLIARSWEPLAIEGLHDSVSTSTGISLSGELFGYRFGMANNSKLREITGSEADVLKRAEANLSKPPTSWKSLDERAWLVLWEWQCTHQGINSARCCASILINGSICPFQLNQIRLLHGKNVLILGSPATGYDPRTRLLQPGGTVVVISVAFAQSPIEIGHIKVVIRGSQGCLISIASTQTETCTTSEGSFVLGFLEKTATEKWSKHVIVITSNWQAPFAL